MYISSNIMAINANRNLKINNDQKAKAMEKLSSGFRINRAADDAAGLALSEKMRLQINGLNQASRNIQDGISLIQTAEGAMQEIHAMLQRMNVLANQASNGIYSDRDRVSLQSELDQLLEEIDSISMSTKFNGMNLLDGSFLSKLQVGVASEDTMDISINDITKAKLFGEEGEALGITGGTATSGIDNGEYNVIISKNASDDFHIQIQGGVFNLGRVVAPSESSMSVHEMDGVLNTLTINFDYADLQEGIVKINVNNGTVTINQPSPISVLTQSEAQLSIQTIQSAINKVSSERGKLGAYQNRLEHTANNAQNYAENLSSSESRIRDSDMAQEMTVLTMNQILTEVGQAMLAQANALPQNLLKLLG